MVSVLDRAKAAVPGWADSLLQNVGLSAPSELFKPSSNAAEQHVRRVPAAGTVPGPRESHTITAVGQRLFVFGGFDGSRVLNDLYVFDSHSGLWSQLVHTGISPPARAGHSATALGVPAHLIVFGGANSSRRFADVQLFDTSDNHWTKPALRGRAPAPRYYHCACLVRGSLVVFGGNDGSSSLGDLHALNTESWSWSEPLTNGTAPTARCGHSGTLVNKLLFVIGGVGDAPAMESHGVELNDVHVLDTDTWTWWSPEVSPPLPPIAYHAAALAADKIFIFGGSSRDALYNDVLMLDSSSGALSLVQEGDAARLPRRRRLGAARSSGTRLITFGGWDGSATCADMLELDTSAWLRIDAAPATGKAARAKAKQPTGGARPTGSSGAGGGFDSGAVPGGAGALEEKFEKLEVRSDEELKKMRGEVARLRMSNELLARDLNKLKAVVGSNRGGGGGGGGGGGAPFDVDDLASRREVEGLRAEVGRLRRQLSAERESEGGALRLEVESLRRSLRALEVRVRDGALDGAAALLDVGEE